MTVINRTRKNWYVKIVAIVTGELVLSNERVVHTLLVNCLSLPRTSIRGRAQVEYKV